MRILVVNWQDRLNPDAGGAEVHLHEVFRRLAEKGHDVTLLVSGWRGAERETEIDGLRVRRAGSRHTFPLRVRGAYRVLGPGSFDVVVEDINKLPLFTPRWVAEPVLGIVHHLFGRVAFREASWPVAAVVCVAERLLPFGYRRTPMVAVSRDTAEELTALGLDPALLRVVHNGVDHSLYRPDPAAARSPEPTVLHVGRLQRYKGLDVVLRAVGLLVRRGEPLRLLIAGRGSDETRLRAVAAREGIESRTEFLGFVPEERKLDLLRRAWVHVYASPKEGWGITNLEAAACGTPSVASDSPGLRESVRHGESGYLVRHADPHAWADAIARVCGDPALRDRLGRGAREHASRFTWESAAQGIEDALRAVRTA